MSSTAHLSQSRHKVDHAFKCAPFKNKQNVWWQEHGGTLMTNVSDLDDAHLDSWTQNMSVKQTTVEGLLKWWCGYGCNGHGVRWVRGRLGGGRQVNVNTRELEWVSTTQPCTLLAIMEMQFSEDALTSALKHDRLICYKWGGGGFIVGSYTLPTYYFALRQSWKGAKRQRGVDRGVKETQLQGDRLAGKEGK